MGVYCMAKKSGGGAAGALALVGLAMVAAIPKDVWIALGVIAVIGAVLYFLFSGKSSEPAKAPPPAPARMPPSRTPAATTYRAPASSPTSSRVPAYVPDEPVPVRQTSPAPKAFKVPDAPTRSAAGSWIPAGQSVTVAGVTIPDGMVYVGSSLPTPMGSNDPALIDPKLNVTKSGVYRERAFGYWPSYSEIPASARRAYLNWLAGGRKDPAADIGYVFLYFYGLERRAILDAPKDESAQADWPRIAEELKRLLGIYGSNHSFHGYASKLLAWVGLATYSSKLYLEPLPQYERGWELPLHLRLVLGQCALDQVPVPATVALAWARLDPNISLRTPATRCAEQFEQLFALKYFQAFGSGMVLPVNKTKLKFAYAPASAGFRGYNDINLTFGNVPDVTVLTAPMKKLQDVVEAATTELDSFSRYLGRNPTQGKSLDALLMLPSDLWPADVRARLQELQLRTERGLVVMKLQELLAAFGSPGTATKDRLVSLARAFESTNIGMEPDILCGAKPPKGEDPVVLFSVESAGPHRDKAAYQAAVLTLQLANAVALADGEMGPEEMRQLRAQVEGWTHLTPAHQQRLRAHLRLLMEAPVSLAVLKKKLEPLQVSAKQSIAKFMAVVAQADGSVSPAEIKMLEKVYGVLGVDPKNVFSDVHAVAAAGKPTPATAPASTLAPSKPTSAPASAGFTLDAARIAALQKDSEQVSALLANIFKDDEVPAVTPTSVDEPAEAVAESHSVAGLTGLDDAHTAFARLLLSRPTWSRQELLDVSSDLELMLDGALERINDASFDVHDVALAEGEDPIEINQELLEKVPA